MRSDENFFHPPHSSGIIRALNVAFRSSDLDSPERTAREYHTGKPVKEDTERRIIEALARTLIEAGLVPLEGAIGPQAPDVETLLADVIDWHIRRWDSLAMGQVGIGMPVRDERPMALAYLRLMTVDLAFRAAAVCSLTDLRITAQQPLSWARKDGRGLLLRSLMKRVGSRRMSVKGRDGLAEQLGVSSQTVDSWLYRGTRPSVSSIVDIGNAIAPHLDGVAAKTIVSDLRRHYALSDIARELATHVGWDEVGDLASAFIRFASGLLSGPWSARADASPAARDERMDVAVAGVRGPQLDAEIAWLRDQEDDPGWRGDLLIAAQKDWGRWLYDLATEIGVAEGAARYVEREYGIRPSAEAKAETVALILDRSRSNSGSGDPAPPPWLEGADPEHAKASLKSDAALDHAQRGLLDEAIRLMRDASDIEPERAWYRVKLAELLADNSLLQSAIDECWIADRLAPDWEQPRVSIGLFLNKAGRFEEAEKHLLATAAHLSRRTLNLSFNLGWAYLERGKPELALIELEAVLEERPEMGLALDMAAFCQFLTGDHVKGWRMAKRAKQLGFGAAYAAASSGEFRKLSKRTTGRRPPAAS